jgi:hypothetical protein
MPTNQITKTAHNPNPLESINNRPSSKQEYQNSKLRKIPKSVYHHNSRQSKHYILTYTQNHFSRNTQSKVNHQQEISQIQQLQINPYTATHNKHTIRP